MSLLTTGPNQRTGGTLIASEKHALHPRANDLTGQRFGRLTAISVASRVKRKNSSSSFLLWLCRCDCGKEHIVLTQHLRSGAIRSCGCLSRDTTATRSTTHGHTRNRSNTAEYGVWRAVISRCEAESNINFHDYGGRGIRICNRWRESFQSFYEDMGERPSPKHEIDRIDNDGSYTCGRCDDCVARRATANCRWVTRKQQSRNKRSNRLITFDGKTMPVCEWAETLGISVRTIRSRLGRGRSAEAALTMPTDRGRKK